MSIKFAEFFHAFLKGSEIMTLMDRIEELCAEKGIKRRQMERDAGLGAGATTKWKQGMIPSQQSLKKVADFFGVSVAYLQGESDYRTEQDAIIQGWNQTIDVELASEESRRYEKGYMIPVIGNVVAGIPIEAVEDVLDWEEISVKLARTGTFFGLKIKGDSMSPRIQEGDVVIVRSQPDADSGQIVIAKVNGDDACCKKLMKTDSGITLLSLNPAYDPMYFTNDEIQSRPVTIVGVVVENRAKF